MVKSYDSVPTIGHGVEVRESLIPNAGKGLFTKQHFRRGDLITEYCGPILSHEAAKQLRISKQHSHVRVLNIQFLYIDGIRDPQDGVGGASFANDGRGFIPNNATFETIYDTTKATDRVFLKALCDLPPETEVLVSYGTTYWNQHGHDSQECLQDSTTEQLQFGPEDLGASEPQQHVLLHQAAGTAQLPGASAAQQVPQQRRQRRRPPWQDVSSTEPFDGPGMQQQQHQQRKRRRPAQRQRQDAVTAEMLADSGVQQQHADQADLSEDFGQQQQQWQGSDATDLSDDSNQQQQQKPPSARVVRNRLSAAQSYAQRKQQAQELEAKHAELLLEHQALQQALAEMEVELQLHRSIATGTIGACLSAAAATAGSAAVATAPAAAPAPAAAAAAAPAAGLYQAEAAEPALAAADSSGLAQRAQAGVQQQQQEMKELQQQHEQQHRQKQDMKHAAKDPAPSAAAAAVPGSSSPDSSCDGSQRPAAMPHSHMLEPPPLPPPPQQQQQQQQQQSAWVVEDATALIAATLEAAAVVAAMPIAQESDIRADTAEVAVTGTSIRQTAAAQADAAAVARQGAEAGVAATATGKLICAVAAAAAVNKKAKANTASRCRNK